MAKGNQRTDTTAFVALDDVVQVIEQELSAIQDARAMLFALMNDTGTTKAVDSITKTGELHLSDKQALLTKINKKIKRLPNEY